MDIQTDVYRQTYIFIEIDLICQYAYTYIYLTQMRDQINLRGIFNNLPTLVVHYPWQALPILTYLMSF